jgi:hypothetical protein
MRNPSPLPSWTHLSAQKDRGPLFVRRASPLVPGETLTAPAPDRHNSATTLTQFCNQAKDYLLTLSSPLPKIGVYLAFPQLILDY